MTQVRREPGTELGADRYFQRLVLPIIGKGQPEGHTGPYDSKLFQPALMQGADAHRLLENLRSRSAALDTTMAIDGEKGVIAISQTNK